MVWGAFSSFGTLPLSFASYKMNSVDYIQMLTENLLPFMDNNEHLELVFQQDNAAIHASRETKTQFENNDVKVLNWPACFPDMNPMENLWGILVCIIYADNKQYNFVQELKTTILQVWCEIDLDTISKLITSMRSHVSDLIKMNGAQTNN